MLGIQRVVVLDSRPVKVCQTAMVKKRWTHIRSGLDASSQPVAV